MRSSEILSALARHNEWADATLWHELLAGAPAELDPKIDDWLHHIHLVQHAFLCLWRGEPLELLERSDFSGLASLVSWGREGHAGLQRFLGAATDADLAKELEIPWTEEIVGRLGKPIGPVSVEQSAHQVAMHSVHHRGQVAARMRELGGEPPTIDFIVWLWHGEPTAEWP